MKYKIQILFGILIFLCFCQSEPKWDHSRLLADLLSYQGLPMNTTRKELVEKLGKPDSVVKQEMTLLSGQNEFVFEKLDLYYYHIEKGMMCFVIYKNLAKIYQIRFEESNIRLNYKHGNIVLSNNLSYKEACRIFSASQGTETSKGSFVEVLIFNSDSTSQLSVYEKPILKFKNGYLSEFFKYPGFFYQN